MDIKRILVPTDFSVCAEEALRLAGEVAQRFDAELVILHVTEPPFDYGAYGLPAETIRGIQKDLKAAVDRKLAAAQKLVGDVKATLAVREGAAATEIVDMAADDKVDLIVISTHGHTGVKHLLLGSIAERVVRTAKCPVMTVRARAS